MWGRLSMSVTMTPMTEPETPRENGQPSEGPGARTAGERWVRRIVIVLVLAVLAVLAYKMAAAAVPRWWGQRIADQVDGRMTAGMLWGLFYGFVFTFVPVLVAWQARRSFLRWPWKLVVLVVAVVLATPNWLTLTISLGDNSASDAGWIALVSRAPGFQWATLIGAVLGALAALALIVTLATARRRRAQVSELRDQLAERETTAREAESPDA